MPTKIDNLSDDDNLSNEDYKEKDKANKIVLQHFQDLILKETVLEDDRDLMNKSFCSDIIDEIEEEYDKEYTACIPQEERVYIDLVPMNDLEKAYIYEDKWPLLQQRKQIIIFFAHISYNTYKVIKHPYFEMITLLVIVFNSIMLATDDPTTDEQTFFQSIMDEIFLALYTAEALMKVIAYGFIIGRTSYLRDAWNILDFTIIVTGWIPYIIGNASVNLNALRSLRVLRPLRTISSVKALRSIMMALFQSFGQLSNAILVLIFTFTVFSIAGLQLFMGYTKQRCFTGMNGITQMSGYGIIDEAYCSTSSDCPAQFICGKISKSPKQNLVSFDNFYITYLQVFVAQTTEGWTDIMQSVQLTFNQLSVLYFLLIILIVTFFLINLMLAIINLNFINARNSNQPIIDPEKNYAISKLKRMGIYQSAIKEDMKIRNDHRHHRVQEFPQLTNLRQHHDSRKDTILSQKKRQKLKYQSLNIKEFSKPVKISSGGQAIKIEGIQGVSTNQFVAQQPQQTGNRASMLKPRGTEDNSNDQFEFLTRNHYRRSSYIKPDVKHDTDDMKNNSNDKKEKDNSANQTQLMNQPPPLIPQQSNKRLPASQTSIQGGEKSPRSHDRTPHSGLERDRMGSIMETPLLPYHNNRLASVLEPQTKLQDDDQISVSLSELQSIPEEEVEERFEELDMSFQKPIKKTFKEIQKQGKRQIRKNRRAREPVQEKDNQDDEKLRIELFQVKLIPRVHFEKPCQSQSSNDILEAKYQKQQQLMLQKRDESLRRMRKKLLYTFSTKIRLYNQSKTVMPSSYQKTNKILPITDASQAQTQNPDQQIIKKGREKNKRQDKEKEKVPILTYQLAQSHISEVIQMDEDMLQQQKAVLAEEKEQEYKHKDYQESIFFQEYQQIKMRDLSTLDDFVMTECSYEEILKIHPNKYSTSEFISAMNSLFLALNYDENAYFIYLAGLFGVLRNIQRKLLFLVESQYFSVIMNSAVAANTIVLAMYGLVAQTSVFDSLNLFFTILFTIELGLKIIANGPKKFVNDGMNLFDAAIVAISLVDLIFFSKGGKSSLGAVRAFRALRVLRITKLMRSLPFMGFLVDVLSAASSSLFYVFLLLLLFIYIFTLLGMSFFGGVLTNKSDQRLNFDTFFYAFTTVFGILTTSNWNDMLYALLQGQVLGWITVPYLISWIFIGNYVLLNLFLSSLLDSFDNVFNQKQQLLMAEIEEEFEKEAVSAHSKSNAVSQAFQSEVMSLKKQEFKYFTEPGICQYSLYIFSQSNFLRKLIYRIIKNSFFEWMILAVILISSIKLVIDTYEDDFQPWLNYFFAFFFGVESCLKIISFGFILDSSSYLRDNWNRLDFIIVVCSFIDVFVDTIDLSFVKILRLLRALRPLRLISQNKSMRLLVTTLINSAGGILGVGVVIVLTMLMFGILGVNLTSGKLMYCNFGSDIYKYNKQTCPPGYWVNRSFNMDNILEAMLSLFILNTQDDWNNYMFYFVDADENGPIKDANLWFVGYFIGYILLVSTLLMNMFVGVILVNYKMADDQAKDKSINYDQENWISTLKLIIDSNPNFALYYAPENEHRAKIFNVVSHRYFDIFIMLNIVGNISVLASYYDDCPVSYTNTLESVNLAFSFVFISEAVLKIISFGWMGYFRNRSNQFDFFVVLTSILDMVISFSGSSVGFLQSAPQITRIFRVLRVSRLFRLVRQLPELKKLIDTAIFSLPALMNVSLLMFLIYFIMSILGVFLFSSVKTGFLISWLNNFNNFHQAFLLLFRATTGENWYLFMYDTMNGVSGYSFAFWVILQLLQAQIMLNLFVLIILSQYEMFYFSENNPLQMFQDYESDFVDAWAPLAAQSGGLHIHQKQVINLMLKVRHPLGYEIDEKLSKALDEWKTLNKDGDQSEQNLEKFKQMVVAKGKKIVSTQIMQMGLSTDENQNLEYHYILFAFMKNFQIKKLSEFVSQEGMQKLSSKEEEALGKIRKKRSSINDVNPCVQLLFVMMSFKAFKRYSEKLRNKKREEGKLFSEKDIDSSYGWKSQPDDQKSFDTLSKLSQNGVQKCVPVPNVTVYRTNINEIFSENRDNKSLESSKSNISKREPLFHPQKSEPDIQQSENSSEQDS